MYKLQIANMTTRQKIIAGIFVLIAILIIWQVIGMFGGGSKAPASLAVKPGNGMNAKAPGGGMQPSMPQPAQLAKQPAMSEREAELVKLQQETQAKYLSALNELQILKINREIAETNQAIMAAKFATVTSQKNIVDLLTKPAATAATYAQGLAGPGGPPSTQPPSPPQPAVPVVQLEVNYTVISVSKLQNRWNAVIGYQGSLFNVFVGDILPPDGSKVIAIGKYGVILEKYGVRKKISMVSII